MEITTELLAAYAGGDIRIVNLADKYKFRGKVLTACLDGGRISITFECVWRIEGCPPPWLSAQKRSYRPRINGCAAVELDEVEKGCIAIFSPLTGEVTQLFRPRHKKPEALIHEGNQPDRAKSLDLQLAA